MYTCKVHGELKYDWCDKCKVTIECDHSKIETKSWIEVWDFLTVYADFCETCEEKLSPIRETYEKK